MKKKESTNNVTDVYNTSAFGIAVNIIRSIYKRNKRIIYFEQLLTLLTSMFLVGYILQFNDISQNKIQEVKVLSSFVYSIKYGLIGIIVVHIIINYLIYRICAAFYKSIEINEEKNYDISKEGYYGTAKLMDGEEKDDTFVCGNYSDITSNILGAEPGDPDKMYVLKEGYGQNDNVYIVGSPGIGKSRCIAIPDIMQTIRRGESMIISDLKGELYEKTSRMAKAHGYIVKRFDVHPKRMDHSDTIDFMGVIGDDDIMAQAFASTIVQNLQPSGSGDKLDFWGDSELNELTFTALYIANNDIGIPKTLGEVYQLINRNSVEELEMIFDALPDTHPAKPAYNTWSSGDKTIKGNTHSGLQIHLQKLANRKIQKITGKKDIDFVLPLNKKCLYFVSMSDQDKSFSFLIALFFTLMCQEMVAYYDIHGGKKTNGSKLNKITILLDEFYSLGKIPDFDVRLSNMRSRGIACIIITQSLGQLKTMYPDELWESILDCCTTWIMLGTNTKGTSEYFSFRCGEQTVSDKSKRYTEKAGDLLKVHTEYMVGENHGKRMALTPHEILTLSPKNILVIVSKHNVVELEKIDYFRHPMNKEIREVMAAKHKPNWIDSLSENEIKQLNIDMDSYGNEIDLPIDLCSEEDFLEAWDEKKQNDLEEEIKKQLENFVKFGVSDNIEDKSSKSENNNNAKKSNNTPHSNLCSEDRNKFAITYDDVDVSTMFHTKK